MRKNKLLIIGPIPSNHGIGGVTIHVQRLLDCLDNQGIKYDFVDYGNISVIKLFKEILFSQVIHVHVSNPVYLFTIAFCGRIFGKKLIVTLHGNYGRFSSFKNFLVRRTLTMANIAIVINKKSFEACKRFNKHTLLISAFIPPQKEENLQQDIIILLNRLHDEGKKIVSTNAYNISYDKDGNEIYGIDFLVNYYKNAVDKVLIVSDPSGNYKKRYINLKSDSVSFINYPHSYFELLKHADFFVRNTSTDGDALSVKEAMYLGVPTLCTDVVDRPDGVRLFKYSDAESFEKALNTPAARNNHIENGGIKILELYKNIL